MNSVEHILKSLQDFYSDTSRSREETLEGLEEVAQELETLIETLQD